MKIELGPPFREPLFLIFLDLHDFLSLIKVSNDGDTQSQIIVGNIYSTRTFFSPHHLFVHMCVYERVRTAVFTEEVSSEDLFFSYLEEFDNGNKPFNPLSRNP